MTAVKIDDRLTVADQPSQETLSVLAAGDFATIINNRPDGEEPSAPQGEQISTACAAEGLAYAEIPVGHAGFSHSQLDALDAVLAGATGPVLAYCRSGTRSTLLWALAQSWQRENGDALTATAANAGYDLSPIRAMMDMLANRPEE